MTIRLQSAHAISLLRSCFHQTQTHAQKVEAKVTGPRRCRGCLHGPGGLVVPGRRSRRGLQVHELGAAAGGRTHLRRRSGWAAVAAVGRCGLRPPARSQQACLVLADQDPWSGLPALTGPVRTVQGQGCEQRCASHRWRAGPVARGAAAGVARRALVALELVTGVTGLVGGVLLMAAPDGSLLRADPATLAGSPFSDWRVPGVLLAGWSAAGSCWPGGGNGAATGMPANCR